MNTNTKMKSPAEIMREIEKKTAYAEKLKKEYDNLIPATSAFDCDYTEYKRRCDEISAALKRNEQKRRDTELYLACLKHNYDIALFAEKLPLILSVLSKYAGKQYGEKTREKIRAEIKEKAGVWFFIPGYRPGYTTGRYFEISECCTGENAPREIPVDVIGDQLIYGNNCLHVPKENNYRIYAHGAGYIYDIPNHIKKMRSLNKKARETREKLEHICKEYNTIVPESVGMIYANGWHIHRI